MAAVLLLAALWFGPRPADSSGNAGTPIYSASSIANSAAGVVNLYAPGTFISIYGQNLSTQTLPLGPVSGQLPQSLGGVSVEINGIRANPWYVSPTLINVLVPPLAEVGPGPATLQVVSDGLAGPPVQITLGLTAPAFFQTDATTVLATHLDGSVVTAASPAHGGEWIVLWAGGLGQTNPAAIPNEVAAVEAQLVSPVEVQLNGVPVPSANINYAGAVVGYAGLYQVNLLVPDGVAPNPEIRIATPDQISPAQRFLMVQ